MRTIAARPTTYKGIRMRSRLEARYAAVLDAHTLDWIYEPRAYANELGQYLPDFLLPASDVHKAMFIEVRPTLELGLLALSQMPVIWDSDPTCILMVAIPDIPLAYMAWGDGSRTWKLLSVEPWS